VTYHNAHRIQFYFVTDNVA